MYMHGVGRALKQQPVSDELHVQDLTVTLFYFPLLKAHTHRLVDLPMLFLAIF
jgi:hypothetical protein